MDKKIQIKRNRINELIRQFFKTEGFLEVQTPTLVKCAGQEPYLSPLAVNFQDEKNKSYQGFLITSPEYSLKKMLAAGFDKIFELAKVFRSKESFGGNHNPEFTMLEWYRTKANYRDTMKDTEKLIFFLNKKINRSNYLNYQGNKINLTLPWPRLSVKSAFLKYSGINLDKKWRSCSADDWNTNFYSVFLNKIEPNFPKDKPLLIYDYPLPQASLAKRKNARSFYAERFEVYIAGIELANAFSELTDAKEQYQRLKEEQKLRKKMKKTFIPIDKDFIFALKLGLPRSSGVALGLERLQMLLLDIKDINDLLLFPAKKLFR